MRAAQLAGWSKKAFVRTTRQDQGASPAPDLVGRRFTAVGPDRLWVADFTYVPTGEGWLYLAFVLDVYSRRIVGWSMAMQQRAELVTSALDMAMSRRRPGAGLIHHSDRGAQYTSVEFGSKLQEWSVSPSMGSVGSAYDNAMAESFVATLKKELVNQAVWRTSACAKTAIFEYIECYYNVRRRHSALEYLSPAEYERRDVTEAFAA